MMRFVATNAVAEQNEQSNAEGVRQLSARLVPAISGVATGYMISSMVQLLTPRTDLLLTLFALLYLVLLGVSYLSTNIFLIDGRIDAYESVATSSMEFISYMFFFIIFSLGTTVATETIVAWPSPSWLQMVAVFIVLFVVVIVSAQKLMRGSLFGYGQIRRSIFVPEPEETQQAYARRKKHTLVVA